MSTVVLGLDLSLRRTGAVVIPATWQCDGWAALSVLVVEGGETPHSAGDSLSRIDRIASSVVDFARTHGVTHAFVEEHAFHMGAGAHALERAELVGVVKHELHRVLGLTLEPIVASSARKLLFGKLPRKDAKKHAFAQLGMMGCPPTWRDDERDAFVIANAGQSSLALVALCSEAA